MSRLIHNSLWLAPLLVGAATLSATATPQAAEPTASQAPATQAQVEPITSANTPTLVALTPVEQSNSITISANPAQPSVIDQVAAYGSEGRSNDLSQVTSVSQFSDVRPTDWAYQALQSLVERYGCIVGYPDKTYRGNRALSRYEFAAGLNACLDKIQELIAAATADFVKKEDLEVVKKLQEEFGAELAVLRGRVDVLEVRTSTLEKQQFSTTTKLSGEVIFSIADTFGNSATRTGNGSVIAGTSKKDNTNTIFSDRVRLSLNTSFSGKDRLLTRLQAKNTTNFSGAAFTGTNETRLSYDGNNSNSVEVDKLSYRFPLGTKLRIQIDAINDEYYDGLVSSLSPFESSGQGAVSRFGRFNPVYRANSPDLPGSAGVTFDYKFSDQFSLQGAYTADRNSNDPGARNGLFNGAYTALGQIVFRPSKTIDVGLTYAHSYYPGGTNLDGSGSVNLTGSTGSGYAANPFAGNATATDNFAAELQWRFTPKITFGGWFAYAKAHQRSNANEATIVNWAAFLAFPDLLRKGNLGGILVGSPPKVTENDFRATPLSARRRDRDSTIHVEAFYRYRLSENISITPGFFVLFNPEGRSTNDTQFVGTIRTTFTF